MTLLPSPTGRTVSAHLCRLVTAFIPGIALTILAVLLCTPGMAQSSWATHDLFTDGQDYTAYGITDGDQAGSHVHMADLNGDGADDLIVASRGAASLDDLRGPNAGEVYIRFGSPRFPLTQDFFTVPPDVIIYAIEAGDFAGDTLASGDLNNDGIQDLIIGAPRGDGPNNDRPSGGEVYVIYGRESWSSTLDLKNPDPAATNADVTIFGEDQGQKLGDGIATGDVNGDGIDDHRRS